MAFVSGAYRSEHEFPWRMQTSITPKGRHRRRAHQPQRPVRDPNKRYYGHSDKQKTEAKALATRIVGSE